MHILMVSIAMVYLVMADGITVYLVLGWPGMGHLRMAQLNFGLYIEVKFTVLACVVTACRTTANTIIAYTLLAWVVMANMVMAQ